ncbi:Cys-tRNA(Pro) deacylase [Demequina muriae]|uniref:Cys-tRNA(Pro)/Cys-tRNA(Cys) deacylase n=1 Tax=Demequina muriae TaxID=3051664 RepID=A0ABT8GJ59_9MICO|nr:Cys-tRNA(Pro) deacylase [Demequina sp. EGI L300058]MDN4481279.1 Cys-tRNA(Pro) deacylase [Demequina sp. EGI L300058]
MSSHESASTPAVAALLAADVAHTLHHYDHDPSSELSYGHEAAQALSAAPERVFKTLCVKADDALMLAVVPVAGLLDLKAVARAVGVKKAIMAEPDEAERVTGYVLGGISPLGGRKKLPAIIDSSAFDHDQVYVSGGRRGLDIELAPADLVSLTDAATAPIAKDA